MAQLTLSNLTIQFGSVVAVDNLSFHVNDGEFVSLLGPSGCGKTTKLRAIAGFVTPQSGQIRFDDEDMTRVPPQRRGTAMVFQSYALFPHMTVRENIRFGLRMRQVERGEQDRLVDEVVDMLGLAGLEDRRPAQLSGGQQQRVALARAVVTRPRILLFDEPLSNLDAKLREHVRVEIRTLQRRLGITAIFVTHDQAEALNISDRILVMNAGRVEQMGDPLTIYHHPANRFVADFIGLANILEGTVVSASNGRMTLETPLGTLAATNHASVAGDGKVLISWRPEDTELHRDGMPNRIDGTIRHAIFMGNFTDLFVDVASTLVRVQMSNRRQFKEGDPISLSVDEDKFRVLERLS